MNDNRKRGAVCVLVMCAILGSFSGPVAEGAASERRSYAIADRLAIEDAIAQYAHRWDAKDAPGFVSLFTEDVVIERWLHGKLKSRLEGRDALLAYAETSHEGRLADRQTRHHMSAIVFIEMTVDAALTENVVLITHQTALDSVPRVVSSGVYRNIWRKTNLGWKIARRVLLVDSAESSQPLE